MKLSELIKNLQEIVDEHGDIPYEGCDCEGEECDVGIYLIHDHTGKVSYASIELEQINNDDDESDYGDVAMWEE